MKINKCGFGRIIVNNEAFSSDVVITDKGIVPSWSREKWHRLMPADLSDIKSLKPKTVVIGTGFFGFMRITKEVRAFFRDNNIQYFAERTSNAVKRFNTLAKDKNITSLVGLFHITC